MRCEKCGKHNAEGVKYCAWCGTILEGGLEPGAAHGRSRWSRSLRDLMGLLMAIGGALGIISVVYLEGQPNRPWYSLSIALLSPALLGAGAAVGLNIPRLWSRLVYAFAVVLALAAALAAYGTWISGGVHSLIAAHDRERRVETAAELKQPWARPVALALLRSTLRAKTPDKRMRACVALAFLEDRAGVSGLCHFLQDQNSGVGRAAAASLNEIRKVIADKALVMRIDSALEEEAAPYRSAARRLETKWAWKEAAESWSQVSIYLPGDQEARQRAALCSKRAESPVEVSVDASLGFIIGLGDDSVVVVRTAKIDAGSGGHGGSLGTFATKASCIAPSSALEILSVVEPSRPIIIRGSIVNHLPRVYELSPFLGKLFLVNLGLDRKTALHPKYPVMRVGPGETKQFVLRFPRKQLQQPQWASNEDPWIEMCLNRWLVCREWRERRG